MSPKFCPAPQIKQAHALGCACTRLYGCLSPGSSHASSPHLSTLARGGWHGDAGSGGRRDPDGGQGGLRSEVRMLTSGVAGEPAMRSLRSGLGQSAAEVGRLSSPPSFFHTRGKLEAPGAVLSIPEPSTCESGQDTCVSYFGFLLPYAGAARIQTAQNKPLLMIHVPWAQQSSSVPDQTH